MATPITVDAYSGFKANERPRRFVLDERVYEIALVEERWYSPEGMFFRVRTREGQSYVLRCDERSGEWTLQQ